MKEKWMKYSISARLLIIGFLILVLLIPSFMFRSLISERQNRRNLAIVEVSEKWGGTQTITGPILSVPYTQYYTTEDGVQSSKTAYIHILPDLLNITGDINPNLRNRGIYEVVLYNSELQIEGEFKIPALHDLKIASDDIIWEDAFISVGITEMKGIKKLVEFSINNKKYLANPGIVTNDVVKSGVHSKLDNIKSEINLSFSSIININGSSGLLFTPIGKETNVSIRSDWPSPSFIGHFLPNEHSITEDDFTSDWTVLQLNRNFPQKWVGGKYIIENFSFGVDLLIPVDEYQKNTRTAKYAFMFISLTFLSFFMIELLNRKIIHPIQYLLIGFALLVFYSLLLSLSEQIVFKYAYMISSTATILLITTYTISVFKNRLQTSIIFSILVLLYIYLFVVVQLQDYALLIGSIGLFVILSLVMYLTRKIDWFSTLHIHGEDSTNNS